MPVHRQYLVLMGNDPSGDTKEVAITETGALMMDLGNGLTTVTPTKGTVLVGNGTTFVGLPVGTNGQVLKANSATATGLEWATDAT